MLIVPLARVVGPEQDLAKVANCWSVAISASCAGGLGLEGMWTPTVPAEPEEAAEADGPASAAAAEKVTPLSRCGPSAGSSCSAPAQPPEVKSSAFLGRRRGRSARRRPGSACGRRRPAAVRGLHLAGVRTPSPGRRRRSRGRCALGLEPYVVACLSVLLNLLERESGGPGSAMIGHFLLPPASMAILIEPSPDDVVGGARPGTRCLTDPFRRRPPSEQIDDDAGPPPATSRKAEKPAPRRSPAPDVVRTSTADSLLCLRTPARSPPAVTLRITGARYFGVDIADGAGPRAASWRHSP